MEPTTAANETLRENIISVLKNIFDPEIPVNIHELGLIYEVRILEEGNVEIDMTLTSPACPAAQSLPGEVRTEVSKLPGVADVHVEVVWEPQWNPDMMTEEAKLTLGFM
jgi:FeS assembly SUF system protein